MEVLESVNPSELDDIVEKVLDAVEKQPCKYNHTTGLYRSAALNVLLCLSKVCLQVVTTVYVFQQCPLI